MTSNMIYPILIGIAVIALGILFFASYIKAAPDEVKIISGFRQPRTIIGHSGFRIPFLEQVDTLSLKLIPIDVKTSGIPTSDYINIAVDAVVQVKISDETADIKVAAQNFLNKNPDEIKKMITEVLEANMREIVGQMELIKLVKL